MNELEAILAARGTRRLQSRAELIARALDGDRVAEVRLYARDARDGFDECLRMLRPVRPVEVSVARMRVRFASGGQIDFLVYSPRVFRGRSYDGVLA